MTNLSMERLQLTAGYLAASKNNRIHKVTFCYQHEYIYIPRGFMMKKKKKMRRTEVSNGIDSLH